MSIPGSVAEFLLLDDTFPRSLRFCVAELNRAVRHISGVAEGQFCNDAEKLTGRLLAELQFGTIDEIFEVGLHRYLDEAAIQAQQHWRRPLSRLHLQALSLCGRGTPGAAGGAATAEAGLVRRQRQPPGTPGPAGGTTAANARLFELCP